MDLVSGYPYWLIKDGLPYSYSTVEKSMQAEVAVLGAGISGALVAFYLVNAGVRCIVVDSRTIGFGSTCASTSLLQYEIDTPLVKLKKLIGSNNAERAYQLCAQSIDTIKEICQRIGFTDIQEKRSLYYAAYKKDRKFLKAEYEQRKSCGLVVDYLDENEIKDEFDFSAPAAILSQKAAQTNAYALTHALHQQTLTNGGLIYDRTRITSVQHNRSGIVLNTDRGHQIKAGKLVYATGYEAADFFNKKIVSLHSTYAFISEQYNHEPELLKKNLLIWNTDNPYLYMRTTPDRRILVGGRDENFSNPAKRDKLLTLKTKQLTKDFKKLFPSIPLTPEFSWTGTFGATKDGLPFIGPFKKLPNSFFALGYGGNGITFSQIAAEILTNIITGKKNDHLDMFSFDRI